MTIERDVKRGIGGMTDGMFVEQDATATLAESRSDLGSTSGRFYFRLSNVGEIGDEKTEN
jgi:hypothetical protein